jgi:IS30 family transposase
MGLERASIAYLDPQAISPWECDTDINANCKKAITTVTERNNRHAVKVKASKIT